MAYWGGGEGGLWLNCFDFSPHFLVEPLHGSMVN